MNQLMSGRDSNAYIQGGGPDHVFPHSEIREAIYRTPSPIRSKELLWDPVLWELDLTWDGAIVDLRWQH